MLRCVSSLCFYVTAIELWQLVSRMRYLRFLEYVSNVATEGTAIVLFDSRACYRTTRNCFTICILFYKQTGYDTVWI